ncbi:transporter substrate-binding domain-containing protein [Sorangium sp. So ce1099]|uniref:transporter substrate-binding domain-containing protein n=1 Tax=Sorangium sp. So ce1099 TaxID=3133331 RepID=UPI003F618C6F
MTSALRAPRSPARPSRRTAGPRITLALVLGFAAAGCARPDGAVSARPAGAASAGPAASAAPAVSAAPDAGAAASSRPAAASLRAGTSGDYPPFSVWKDDHAEAFSAALLGGFAAEQRLALSWTRFRWPDLVGDLRAGRFDLAADGITVRPERSIAGRFTVPVARGGAVLLLRRPAWATPTGSPGLGLEGARAALRALDRPELRVAVNRGGHLERVARSFLRRAQVVAISDNSAVRETFAHGDADAALTNTFEAPRWAEGLDRIERLGPLTRDVAALYVRADRPELAAQLDTWLLAEEERGALEQLRALHLGPGGGGPTALPVDALLCATAERLALMPLVAATKRRAGRAIEDPAQEARVLAAGRAAVLQAAAARGAPPPADDAIHAFFRAQIESAKAVERRALAAPETSEPVFSLDDDLRPAIARITARMAFLLVRLPRGLTRESVLPKARDDLAESGLAPEQIERLVAALVAIGG